jgi:hypothetical protein
MAATGKRFRVPFSVIYDLDGDRIKALRIYMPIHELLSQLGEPAGTAQAGTPA